MGIAVTMSQDHPKSSADSQCLVRRLTLRDTVSLVAGSVIGVGIFLMPNQVANLVPVPSMMLAIWAAAGIVSMFGALAIAELGSQYPQAGGLYVYLREAYGRPVAFLYGWSLLVAIQTGNTASLAAAIPIYLGYMIPLGEFAAKLTGIAAIAVLTAANCMGIRRGALVQNVLTIIKIATLGLMTMVLLISRRPPLNTVAPVENDWTWVSLGLACVAVLYAYECWHLVTFAAGEVARPEKNIPRGLIIGMTLVIVLYLAANAGYLRILSVHEIQSHPYVAASSLEAIMGAAAGSVVSAMILFSLLGAMNGLILSGPRVYYAMARDGVFFERFGEVSPRYQVPIHAIILQGILAAILTLIGSFAQLVGYAISSAWIFYALAVVGVWKVRRCRSQRPAFLCPAYPLLGCIFVAFAGYIVLSQVARQPRQSVFAGGLILMGLPLYWLWSRGKRAKAAKVHADIGE